MIFIDDLLNFLKPHFQGFIYSYFLFAELFSKIVYLDK